MPCLYLSSPDRGGEVKEIRLVYSSYKSVIVRIVKYTIVSGTPSWKNKLKIFSVKIGNK